MKKLLAFSFKEILYEKRPHKKKKNSSAINDE